jgi:altronate dehydratase
MRVSKEIKKVGDIVEKLLREDKKYRDSDKKLSAKIWAIQCGGMDKLKEISAYEFLCEYVNEDTQLISQESIGRARRKIQEETPELRGEKYAQRQNEQEEVKNLFGYGK